MENASKKRTGRKATSLNLNLDRKVAAYVAAGSAAGIGVLALAPPAEAEIVYTATHIDVQKRIGIPAGGRDCLHYTGAGHPGQ